MKVTDISHDDFMEVKQYARDLFANALLLEEMEIHPSWERSSIEDYLLQLVDDVKLAYEIVHDAVDNLGKDYYVS